MSVVDSVEVTDELTVQLVQLSTGRLRLVLRPLRPDVYYRTHDEVSLTMRELDLILDLLQRNHLCRRVSPP